MITLTSDFGVQSQGVGLMEGVILSICQNANVIHLMHGLPSFGLIAAARTLESVQYLNGGTHVCVCDPGVGSKRKAIIIKTERSDYLIGPDNGILIPAANILGGVKCAHELSNTDYMRKPVSPIFHGRDIFAPAAAHISNGVSIEEFGDSLPLSSLHPPVYNEAFVDDNKLICKIIQINKFGSIHLNVNHSLWDSLGLANKKNLQINIEGHDDLSICPGITFSDVYESSYIILKDDYGRVEIAKNKGSFANDYPTCIGSVVMIYL